MSDCGHDQRIAEQPRSVAAAMVTDVKLSSIDVTVGELRALFEDEHVHAAIIVSGGRLATVIDRCDVQGSCPDGMAAVAVGSRRGRVVTIDTDLQDAQNLLRRNGRRRLAVVEPDGTFRGLLCLKRTGSGFCSDADVRARAMASAAKALVPM